MRCRRCGRWCGPIRGASVWAGRRRAVSGASGGACRVCTEGPGEGGRVALSGRQVTLLSGVGNSEGEGCLGKGRGGLPGRGLVWRLLVWQLQGTPGPLLCRWDAEPARGILPRAQSGCGTHLLSWERAGGAEP